MGADDEWDADDYEIPAPITVKVSDKWEGEDEEEPVKDSWEDEENEKNQVSTPAPVAPSKKKGKKLEEKIAERKRKAKEEAEQKRMSRQENMTPEERLADKLYRQKLVEESDFEMAEKHSV